MVSVRRSPWAGRLGSRSQASRPKQQCVFMARSHIGLGDRSGANSPGRMASAGFRIAGRGVAGSSPSGGARMRLHGQRLRRDAFLSLAACGFRVASRGCSEPTKFTAIEALSSRQSMSNSGCTTRQ